MATSSRSRRPAPKRGPSKRTTTAKRAPARPRARSRSKARHDPLVNGRQLADIAGLVLVALGLFSALVLWGGVNGAFAGAWIADAGHGSLGRLAVVVPAALVCSGVLLFGGIDTHRLRRPSLGGAILLLALLLLVSDDTTSRATGGWLGGTLHSTLSGVIGGAGVILLGLVLLAAGVLVLSGTTVGAVAARLRDEWARTTEAVRDVLPEREWADEDDFAPAAAPATRRRGAGPLVATAVVEDVATLGEPSADFPEPFNFDDLQELSDAETDEASAATAVIGAEEDLAPWEEPEVGEDLTGDQTADLSFDPDAPIIAPVLAHVDPDKPPYRLPDADVLRMSRQAVVSTAAQEAIAKRLLDALASFGVEARLVGTVSGPRVTRFEIQLAPGTKVSKVTALKDDLAYGLATTDIRILAPIPGKQAVGVEVPNPTPNMVTLGDIHGAYPAGSSPLTVWLGKDISGNAVCADLAKMPHLLVAGTTGSGKSGCLNAMLTSILLNATPEEVRLILIDPKKVELNHYEAIPHLLTPVVTNMKGASAVLLNIVSEMERRYEQLGTARARNITEFNKLRREQQRETMPYVLVVIDELADLMMVSPAEVEDSIIRLAQKSRAVGIHLVLATQRPSVDVITGMIKANVPSRIAFAVSSMTDSRVILDGPGAESLLGQGDMLFRPLGTSRLQRVQGAFLTEEEIAMVVDQCRRQAEPEFEATLLELPQISDGGDERGEGDLDPDRDPLLDDAIKVVVNHETASVSLLQRRLRVGYTRAGRLIDMLERRGVISGYEGSKPRTVLITEQDLPRLLSKPAPATE